MESIQTAGSKFLADCQIEIKRDEVRRPGLVTDRDKEEIHSDESGEDSDLRAEFLFPKAGPKGASKRNNKLYSNVMKTLLNIIYLSIKTSSYEELQNNEKLITQLVVYLTTDQSIRNREKETLFVNDEMTLENQPVFILELCKR